MNDCPTTLPDVATQIWALLQAAVDSKVPADRFVTLATVDVHCAPQVRTVALRRANQGAGMVEVFTDLLSRKTGEIAQNPKASVLFWHPETRVQVRLSGTAMVKQGLDVAKTWNTMPQPQHINYSHMPPPGRQIGAYDGYEQRPSQDRFAILWLNLTHIDYVCLAPDIHRRAEFKRTNNWKGQWLSP